MASNFNRYTAKNVGTASVALKTVPANQKVTLIGLSIANTTNAVIKASAMINDGTSDIVLVKEADVAIGGTLIVVGGDQKVVMIPGDSLKVYTNTANAADAYASALELS